MRPPEDRLQIGCFMSVLVKDNFLAFFLYLKNDFQSTLKYQGT
jgi:hypothetical protein